MTIRRARITSHPVPRPARDGGGYWGLLGEIGTVNEWAVSSVTGFWSASYQYLIERFKTFLDLAEWVKGGLHCWCRCRFDARCVFQVTTLE